MGMILILMHMKKKLVEFDEVRFCL